MKKFLISFFIFSSIFAGFSIPLAYGQLDGEGVLDGTGFGDFMDNVGSIADIGLSIPGEIARGTEEFNLKVEYFNRPYKERDLTFEEWLELYGYTTYGAGPIPHGDFSLPEAEEFAGVGANTDLRRFILNVVNWVLSFLGLICVAMVIYAGYLCIITGGEDGSEKCKKILMYVAIGIIIILVSYALVNTIIRSTIEGGDNFAGISISSDLVEGNIIVTGGGANNYGAGYIVDSGADIVFEIVEHDYGLPEEIQWNFGDGSIDTTSGITSTRTFFDEGFRNIIAIGRIKEIVDTNGDGDTDDADDYVYHDYMARVKILVGNSVLANFVMNPMAPSAGSSVHFNAGNSQALVGSITNYNWNCESDPASLCTEFVPPENDDEFDFTFTEEGEATITLEVVSNIPGESATFSETFNVSGVATSDSINAHFNVSTTNIIKDATVQFLGMVLPAGVIVDNYIWSCEAVGTTSDNICTEFNNDSDGNPQFYTSFPETGNMKISLVVEKDGEESLPYEDLLYVSEAGGIAPGGVSSGINDLSFEAPSAIRLEDNITFSVDSNLEETPDSYKWTFLDGEQLGESVMNTFGNVGENIIKVEAVGEEGEVLATKEKTVLVAEQGAPIPVLSINGETIFPNEIKEIVVGESINFQTNSFDSSGNQGSSANVTHSWVLNGSVINEEALSDLSSRVGNYVLKLNAISTLDSNKRTALNFRLNIKRETPEVSLNVENSSLGEGLFNMKAQVETETTLVKQYKFEVIENGRTVATQVINSTEKNMEAVVDVSNYRGDHNYLFQVTLLDKDGRIVKKSENKSVTVNPENINNNPPSVEIFTTPATSGLTSTMFRFYVQADDLDNDFLTYKWEFPNGKKLIGKSATHKFLTAGENKVKVTVSDGIEEVEATETISVEQDENTLGNNAPQLISSGISPGNSGNTSTVFRFYSFAEDPDGDELDYSWIMGDGNVINLQNVSYTYQFPGRYSAKLRVSDGQKIVTKTIPVTVVDTGEEIPVSTLEDYESMNPINNSSVLSSNNISINSNLTDKNIDNFSEQVDQAVSDKRMDLAGTTDIENRANLEKEINLMESINDLIVNYETETDPISKKVILQRINQKRLELEALNAELKFEFIGLEGGLNTKFFFYSKIPKSDRPIMIKWDTGDNRSFIGQNVSWKYNKTGNYVVQMEVSDGISVATDSINIKIK